MSDPPASSRPACSNCNTPLTGNFCAQCGQEAREIRRPFFYLIADGIRAVFELDGRAYRSVYYLLTRPGFLTSEYVSGRRASYTPPLRLFLVISIGFFLLVSFVITIQSFRESLQNQDVVTATTTESQNPVNELLAAEDVSEDDLLQVLNLIDDFSIPFISEERNENLRRVMRSQGEANLNVIREDPADFFYGSLEYITVFILLMMPILALIQKLLYLRSNRYYVEHLILTLHNHTFLILAFFLASMLALIDDLNIVVLSPVFSLLNDALSIWIFVYLFLSLKFFFAQGYAVTTVKFITMGFIYTVVTALGIFYFAAVLFFLF